MGHAGMPGPLVRPYPFSAVVGLADLRLALLLNAVSPAIGGVLVRGEKGTAKSTMVRALAALLPPVPALVGCRFSCDPAAPYPDCPDGPHPTGGPGAARPARLVELPVGAAEDRLVGTLDLERALTAGQTVYQPGLLAAAHRGLLYVDEVNLLPDHLVDLLLDAAALGVCYVERENVSVRHAARFLLVGTMNPEEGELRPQLLDRFGLTVQVTASRDPDERTEVVRRRLAFDADPAGFGATWHPAEEELAGRIVAARGRLPGVRLPDAELRRIARVCTAFEVDGMRADLVCARAALALAAWRGRDEVTPDDVRKAAELALPHRRRRNPFDAPGLDAEELEQAVADPPDAGPDGPPPESPPPDGSPPDGSPPNGSPPESPPPAGGPPARAEPAGGDPPPDQPGAAETVAPVGSTYRPRLLVAQAPNTDHGAGPDGRRSVAELPAGRTVRARRPVGRLAALHLVATVRAAAPHQRSRGRDGRLELRRTDLREAVRQGREGNLVVFCVDASGSMAARTRMTAVKGAVMSLLTDAYQRRDRVGLITFRGAAAELVLPPTSSVEVGARRLAELPTGGRTPLAAGLLAVHELLQLQRVRDPRRRPLVVLLTDGRATHPGPANPGADPVGQAMLAAGLLRRSGTATVVVDCETGPVHLGLAGRLAVALGGVALRLEELAAQGLLDVVRGVA